jgi:putative FmdB family regulatory protein
VPTYQYACTECAEQLEVVQRFTDDPLTTCPACGGRLRKVFSPVGVLFKGSGFYRTDSRPKEKSAEPAKASDSSGTSGSGPDSSSTSTERRAPAATAKKAESAA